MDKKISEKVSIKPGPYEGSERDFSGRGEKMGMDNKGIEPGRV
jgi:hypothetical protein